MKRWVRNSSLFGSFATAPSYILHILPGSWHRALSKILRIVQLVNYLKFPECNGHGIECSLINWVWSQHLELQAVMKFSTKTRKPPFLTELRPPSPFLTSSKPNISGPSSSRNQDASSEPVEKEYLHQVAFKDTVRINLIRLLQSFLIVAIVEPIIDGA